MAGTTEKPGNSLLETKRRNRILIRNAIFRTPNATRVGIADALGLTLPTITTSVNEMLHEGLLEEIPIARDVRTSSAGRRPNAIAFRSGAACAVGVELGPYATRAVLMDLGGNILSCSEKGAGDASYEKMLADVTDQIRELLPDNREGFLGVAIGIPGFVDRNAGVIRSIYRGDWAGHNFAADLADNLKVPVIIDNNVRIRAMACDLTGRGELPDIFAYLYVSRGIACPVIVRNEVISGSSSGSGEIGHMLLDMKEGRYVEVDDLSGDAAVLRACREKYESGELPEYERFLAERGSFDMHAALELQQAGNPVVEAVLKQAVEVLGIALSNMVNLLNPGVVVVDGYMMTAEQNRKALVETARAHFFGLNEEEVQIRFLLFDHFRGAKAGAYFAIRELFLGV